jgi:hypothetical protein
VYAKSIRKTRTDAVEVISVATEDPTFDVTVQGLVKSMPARRGLTEFFASGLEWNRVFVSNPRGEVLAGEYYRTEDKKVIGWVLPSYVRDMHPWVKVFLQRVHDLDPSRVPVPPADWVPWDTAEESRLRAERDAIQQEANEVLQRYVSELESKDGEIETARQRARTGHGRLLTDDGDSLKEAVRVGLQTVGLEVVDADDQVAIGQGKREDLWVRVPQGTVIAEVKGYTKGASSGDLVKAQMYQTTFLERCGSRAAGQWHIVNANRGVDPSQRPRLFEGAEDIVDSSGILVIDTRHLFVLVRDIQLGVISRDEAQRLLVEAEAGFWSYPIARSSHSIAEVESSFTDENQGSAVETG